MSFAMLLLSLLAAQDLANQIRMHLGHIAQMFSDHRTGDPMKVTAAR